MVCRRVQLLLELRERIPRPVPILARGRCKNHINLLVARKSLVVATRVRVAIVIAICGERAHARIVTRRVVEAGIVLRAIRPAIERIACAVFTAIAEAIVFRKTDQR